MPHRPPITGLVVVTGLETAEAVKARRRFAISVQVEACIGLAVSRAADVNPEMEEIAATSAVIEVKTAIAEQILDRVSEPF